MDWGSERYVRLYIRDTADWLMLRWESRALLPLLLRKIDRTGVVDLGKRGRAVLGVLVGLPDEVAQSGLDGLLEDGCIVLEGSVLRSPNFVEAQTTRSSDAIRQGEARRRKQAESVPDESPGVTSRHPASPDVTSRHPASPDVTLAVLSGAVPSGTEKHSSASADAQSLLDAWNANCLDLPKATKLTDKRRRHAAARLRERAIDGPDGWIEAIKRIAASDFCNGRTKSGNWRASFDWLLEPDSAVKALEGKYDNASSPASTGPKLRKFTTLEEALNS